MARNDRKMASQSHSAHRKNVASQKTRFVIVMWKDHYAVTKPAWMARDALREALEDEDSDALVFTGGFVVFEDKERLVIAQSIGADDKQSDNHMVVYKALIVKEWKFGELPSNG